MHVQVHYSNLENSPWMDQFIEQRVNKLSKYLSPSASIQVHLRFENRKYFTTLAIHNGRDYAFTSEDENLYGAFALTVDKASRVLGEHKRRIKDKINRKYYSIKHELAS